MASGVPLAPLQRTTMAITGLVNSGEPRAEQVGTWLARRSGLGPFKVGAPLALVAAKKA